MHYAVCTIKNEKLFRQANIPNRQLWPCHLVTIIKEPMYYQLLANLIIVGISADS